MRWWFANRVSTGWRALEMLASDERLRDALGQAAANRALGRPAWEESAGLFFGAIREVAGYRP